MRFLFWFLFTGICYTYLGYPALMWVLARLMPRRWKVEAITPSVSIVMAVHNGAALIEAKLQHLLSLDYPNIEEIIVVSDGSTDGTVESLTACNDPRLKIGIISEHQGKAVALNAGVAEATGDIVLFVDIRPEIGPGAIQQLVSNFADAKVGCVTGKLTLRYDGHDRTSAAVGGLYWRYEEWIRTSESAFDSTVGVYGGFYAVRRALVVSQPSGIILDDMFQPLSIIRQGYRAVVDNQAHVCDTWPKTTAGEFHRKVRTLAGNFQLVKLAPWTLTPQNRVLIQFASHKLMRLAAPYFLVGALLSSLALLSDSPVYAAIATLQILSLVLSISALRYQIPLLSRIASPASAILVLNTAAVVGLYRFLFTRGPLWRIWNSNGPQVPALIASVSSTNQIALVESRQTTERGLVMKLLKSSVIFSFGIVVGIGTSILGYGIHAHVNFAAKTEQLTRRAVAAADSIFGSKVRAAKLEGTVPSRPYFPPGSVWTQDASKAPIDPNSSVMINALASAGGWGIGRMQVDFNLRVLHADAKTRNVPFRKGAIFYSPDSDLVTTFPLPENGGIEGGNGYSCDISRNDCHLIVVDRSKGKLYEAWQANFSDGFLSSTFLGVWDLNRVYPPSGRGDQCTSADAAGYPIAPLLFNADELASGSINHAIRLILPNQRIRAGVFVHPATHAGGPRGPETAPPYGAHFRLKASYDVSKLKPAARIVAVAMQKYGMFLADGGSIALTAQSDEDTKAKYTDLDFGSHDLQALKVTDFEILDTGTPIKLTNNCVRNP